MLPVPGRLAALLAAFESGETTIDTDTWQSVHSPHGRISLTIPPWYSASGETLRLLDSFRLGYQLTVRNPVAAGPASQVPSGDPPSEAQVALSVTLYPHGGSILDGEPGPFETVLDEALIELPHLVPATITLRHLHHEPGSTDTATNLVTVPYETVEIAAETLLPDGRLLVVFVRATSPLSDEDVLTLIAIVRSLRVQ
jgi:hypothetical protein